MEEKIMMNTMLTYTTTNTAVKTTFWTTWEEANRTAEALLLGADTKNIVDDVEATWYEAGACILKRKYSVGYKYFGGEPVVFCEDIEY
jgi:hypothetical protein